MLLTRSPSCLSCLRRSFGQNGIQGVAGLVQIRGKKRGRPRDQGVVVRLLDDIPGFGRKGQYISICLPGLCHCNAGVLKARAMLTDAILRTTRGRMRNLWVPNKKAEYMTTTRFAELGLSSDDIGEPDPLFTGDMVETTGDSGAPSAQRPKLEVQSLAVCASLWSFLACSGHLLTTDCLQPEEAAALLTAALPPVITFSRKPIQAVGASSQPPPPPGTALEGDAAALFGSVSTEDIALKIRELTRQSEASQVRVGGRDVRFVGLDSAVDRVKTLGRWEIDISLGAQWSGSNAQPLRRVVEVVAAQ